jgi:hypothetical protein
VYERECGLRISFNVDKNAEDKKILANDYIKLDANGKI